MPRRTSLRDAKHVERADDVEDVVQDKREGWRATAAKARRRQRRYSNSMTKELAQLSQNDRIFSDAYSPQPRIGPL